MSKYKKQCIVYSIILDETTSKHHPLTRVNTSPTTYKVGDVPEGTVIEHTV